MRLHPILAAAAAAAATAGLAAAGPASPAAAQGTPIKHVVVIYAENHSFDNVLGYWCDQAPGRCPDGGMPSSVTLSNGVTVTPTTDPDTVPVVNHDVAAQLAAMNIQGGVPHMNGWQNIPYQGGQPGCGASVSYVCISGYQPAQIPNIINLASSFAVSDDTFSMADSPSWGGHIYAVSANMDGFTGDNPVKAKGVTPGPGWGCNSKLLAKWISPSGQVSHPPSCVPDRSLGIANGGAFRPTPAAYEPTIMDRLTGAGLPWRIYGAQPGQSGYQWATCPTFAECLDTSQVKNVVSASQFTTDASAGNLPAFSLVTPGGNAINGQPAEYASCHNGFSMTACDNWIGSLVRAVENGPGWSSTAIFITFDDFGGFYDQVPPPRSLNADRQQAGPRSPLIIVSPYARPGFVDTTATSFAGILAYTEHNFGLSPLAANDAAAYDFANAFNYAQAPRPPVAMVQRPLPRSARHLKISRAELASPS
jgi:phospholipase C